MCSCEHSNELVGFVPRLSTRLSCCNKKYHLLTQSLKGPAYLGENTTCNFVFTRNYIHDLSRRGRRTGTLLTIKQQAFS
jgi:hypothetical protein